MSYLTRRNILTGGAALGSFLLADTVVAGSARASAPRLTSPAAGARFPGDPGVGKIYWGQSRQGGVGAMPQRLAQLSAIVGSSVRLGSFHRYMTNAQATVQGAKAAVADAATIQSWGTYPLIDVKEPGSLSFAQAGAGGMDATFDALFEGLVRNGTPVTVSLHNEAAGDGKGGATDYGSFLQRAAQRRDAAGGKGLVTLTGALGMGQFTDFGGGNGRPEPWIDAVAPWVDVWNTHRYLQASDSGGAWKQPQVVYGPFWDLLDKVDPHRAKFHGEWGVHTRSADLAFAPAWMDAFYSYFISRGGALATFFDSGLNLNSSPISWIYDFNGERSRMVKFAQQLTYPTSVTTG